MAGAAGGEEPASCLGDMVGESGGSGEGLAKGRMGLMVAMGDIRFLTVLI